MIETRYDRFGDAREIEDALDQEETRAYDGQGRLISQVHRGGLLTDSYAYDLLGQRIQHWNNITTFADRENMDYDAQGRDYGATDYGAS